MRGQGPDERSPESGLQGKSSHNAQCASSPGTARLEKKPRVASGRSIESTSNALAMSCGLNRIAWNWVAFDKSPPSATVSNGDLSFDPADVKD